MKSRVMTVVLGTVLFITALVLIVQTLGSHHEFGPTANFRSFLLTLKGQEVVGSRGVLGRLTEIEDNYCVLEAGDEMKMIIPFGSIHRIEIVQSQGRKRIALYLQSFEP